MKKQHSTAIIAAMAVFSIALLAGCRELPGKEAADNQLEQSISGTFKQDAAEAVKQGLSNATVAVGDVVQHTTDMVQDTINENGISREFSTSLPADSASLLKLDNALGEVVVMPASGDEIAVKATVIVHEQPGHKLVSGVLDHAEVSIEHKGDALIVSTHSTDNTKKSLWDWAQKKYGDSNFSINYVIELPDTVGKFEIDNNVGTVQIRGLEGTFDINSNVGSIILQDSVITGKSSVESNTGSIELAISGMDKGSSLKAKSNIGTITADLADLMKCTVKARSELGDISGVVSGEENDFNGGGPLVSLSTEIGAISVNP
ncbi:hypothetical protein HQN87_12480 [Paenibacillus tritici]|uniref:Adhesin domain-containing protein n=1 Tax=Paenibacillus tritici TaxID=1873425 RepID=A0ABX2DNE5_9BACL|nr:hypothetical protein [Paenibacillus tritici]NQX46147.1 hypothetical protein [Paenibacillus tritici]